MLFWFGVFRFFGGFALGFFDFVIWFLFLFSFSFFVIFVILIVVAYCTQLPSQAMYNLMMATTMAETCSC